MSSGKATVWGDIFFLSIIVAVFFLVLFLLKTFGLVHPIQLIDKVLIGGALLALGINAIFNIYSSEGHAYHRLGFELCGLTLGTCLSLLVAKVLSGTDALPRLGYAALDMTLSQSQQVSLVSLVGLGSILGMGITAHIVRSVEGDIPPPCPEALSFISFLFGVAIMFGYITVLLGAGA